MPGLAVLLFDADLRVVAGFGGALSLHGHPGDGSGRPLAEVLPADAWE